MIIELALEGDLDDQFEHSIKKSQDRLKGHGVTRLPSSVGGFDVLAPRDRISSFEFRSCWETTTQISSDIDQHIILYGGNALLRHSVPCRRVVWNRSF